ncbi:DUF3841 domain-containing protein [Enterococcus hulanensis]|uniref:DUF3841 domain-containing protein n=1 Tax=Enterococcus hulanensis TaxID=2559929 RepID=UPI002891529C|nr:DUF3841 domain-containing protein [Enterococcus hulanensis]MDT2659682.1 DUF3841 domain-containing protein [Enterococcus hulanensis]
MGNSQRMDYKDHQVILYTSQNQRVIDKLLQNGRHVVERTFIKEKYGETSQVFLQAYSWYRQNAEQVVERPEDAESAIWTFLDMKYLDYSADSQILKLRVPLEKIVFFRMSDWNKILNLHLLGTDEEQADYYAKLKKFNIAYEGDVYTTAFYPHLKTELVQSWRKLFQYDKKIKETKELPFEDIQGGIWEIRSSWIESFAD